jgi:Putative MetA-pathway of phenol degradation
MYRSQAAPLQLVIGRGLVVVLLIAISTTLFAQGPSSRGSFAGPAVEREVYTYDQNGNRHAESILEPSEGPEIPDLFKMEAPSVERNFRTDYIFTNNLQDPPSDESQFFGEVDYSFSEQFGMSVASPLLIRENDDGTDTTGFGDLEVGARYVAIGSDPKAPFKLAFGFNVTAPTGDVDKGLGTGVTFLDPQILMLRKLPQFTFVQTQLGLEIPTDSGETTEFAYNVGMGRIYPGYGNACWFRNPTPTIEFNGTVGVGGLDAGRSVLDVTPGLRWMMGKRTFAGVAMSVPMTGQREFETQYIFSLIHQYGPEEPTVERGATSSRAAY